MGNVTWGQLRIYVLKEDPLYRMGLVELRSQQQVFVAVVLLGQVVIATEMQQHVVPHTVV